MLDKFKRWCYQVWTRGVSTSELESGANLKQMKRGSMILHAKRLTNNGTRAFDRVKDEWLRWEPLTDSIFKAWLSIDKISVGSVRSRVRQGDRTISESGPVYIEEATYIVSENDRYTYLFSFSKTSLEACSETMRKCGGASEKIIPDVAEFAAEASFRDEAVIERSAVYDSQFGGYSEAILDPPISKGNFLKMVKGQQKGEVKGLVFRAKETIEGEIVRLVSIGIYGNRWDLFLVGKKSSYSIQLSRDNEQIWAKDVARLLAGLFSNPASFI